MVRGAVRFHAMAVGLLAEVTMVLATNGVKHIEADGVVTIAES